MFKNYLKVAFRNITHHKGYSFISIFGLAIGISCCLFIFQYVHHELTYDTHHKEHDRIFRVAENIRKKTGDRIFAIIAFPVVPTLKETFPQVEEAGRFFPIGSGIVKNQKNNKVFYESKRFAVEQELLNIFTFNFIKGNPSNALARPNTVVITEGIAGKYFGKTEPLGQMLKIDKYECEVTGVVANPPSNTHWKYDILLSMKTYGDSPELTNWYGTSAYSYIKIAPNVDAAVFEKKMSNIADKYISERTKSRGISYVFSMQPLADIHLHSDLRYEVENPGNYQMIFIFASIGLLVLLIACINFINLATARSVNRAREVGVRKVVGGQRKQLILQFLSESFMVVILSIFA
ncbi:MAG: hypothetical protein GY757_37835, partial [bacterium]|nr:hypothetical protein [bacterium]